MEKPIAVGQLKDKSLFQDSDGSAVPAKSVCHNCSKLKVWREALTTYFLGNTENDNLNFYQNSVLYDSL